MFLLADGSDPFTPNYGCGFADIACYAAEGSARIMGSTIKNFGDFIADMVVNAFNHPIGQGSWDVAHGQFLFWLAVMAPIIMIIAMVQIGIGAILQDGRRIGRVAVGAVLAAPFSAICVYGMQRFSALTDSVTGDLTATLQGGSGGSLADSLLRIMGVTQVAVANNTASIMTQADMRRASHGLSARGWLVPQVL